MLIIYGIINSVICIIIAGIGGMWVISEVLSMLSGGGVFLNIPLILFILFVITAISGVFSIFRVRSFYKLRAEEDADYTEEEIAAEKDYFSHVTLTQQLTSVFSVATLIPLAGWFFMPPAVALTINSIKKELPIPKIFCLPFGLIINIIFLFIIFG